ncbi:DNA-3-methyladenine glycosylase I [Magnetovibrio sp. PR-2]|uniref:DNA-3-methyladenine glycosylase I n=1 Tax=Magnetovibrio sp. PR-2 TaxID=3120356 RepID=UPI002FCE68A3
MEPFKDIYDRAAQRHGGAKALEAGMAELKTAKQLKAIPDDRWLADFTKRIFQAGFSWKVIDNKWPGFEEAFEGFDPVHCAYLSDEDVDKLLQNEAIVRNAQKIVSVRANAQFLNELAKEHGSASAFIADWPMDDFIGLMTVLKKRGSRLGGNTGPYALRMMGKDSFIISKDVTAALIHADVIDKNPTSQKALRAVQDAFNAWHAECGKPYAHISRMLGMSIDA